MNNDNLSSFNEEVYKIVSQIPKGRVMSYKKIAEKLECRAYRAVGNALNKNPYSILKVPCHRVIKSNLEVGGYAWNIRRKIELLQEEGIRFKYTDEKCLEKSIIKKEHVTN